MNNLGFFTDFKLLGSDAKVTEYVDYYLVETPTNPTFIDGNCMVLKSPDLLLDKDKLEKLFKCHFSEATNQHHVGFRLMHIPSDEILAPYLQNDQYQIDNLAVMTYDKEAVEAKTVLQEERDHIRPFSSDLDWEQWTQHEIRERPTVFSEASFKAYLLNRRNVYKTMITQEMGNFYGVFRDGKLLAAAGLYIFDKIGRFQQVRTIESARRQGLCKRLIQHIYTVNMLQMEEAVIVADEDYHALKIYEGLGFRTRENQYDLTKVVAQ